MQFPAHYPEILADLATLFYTRLAEQRVPEAEALARALAEDMRLKWGGGLIYIPKGDRHLRDRRDADIWRQFNGRNHAELARRHGLGIAAIYNILDRERERRQHDMFRR